MTLSLKQKILNECELQRGLAEQLAKLAGYSSGSSLGKVLKSENKEFDKLFGLIKIVQVLFPSEEKKLISQYAKTLDPNKKTARYILEYLSVNRELDSMKQLIDRMKYCENRESQEWAKVYSILYHWQVSYHALDTNSVIEEIRDIRTSVHELKILLKLMECNCYYRKKLYKISYELSDRLVEEVLTIKDEYLRNSYEVKLNEILSYLYIRVQFRPKEARNKAIKVLDSNIGATFNAYANYTIGCSYFFENYDEALKQLTRSSDTYKEINRDLAAKDVEETIEKLNIFYEKALNQHEFTLKENLLFNEIKKGNDVAIKLEVHQHEIDEPFYNYLLGLNNKVQEKLILSALQYSKRGDSFWANLPMIELKKLGYSELILNELIKLNIA